MFYFIVGANVTNRFQTYFLSFDRKKKYKKKSLSAGIEPKPTNYEATIKRTSKNVPLIEVENTETQSVRSSPAQMSKWRCGHLRWRRQSNREFLRFVVGQGKLVAEKLMSAADFCWISTAVSLVCHSFLPQFPNPTWTMPTSQTIHRSPLQPILANWNLLLPMHIHAFKKNKYYSYLDISNMNKVYIFLISKWDNFAFHRLLKKMELNTCTNTHTTRDQRMHIVSEEQAIASMFQVLAQWIPTRTCTRTAGVRSWAKRRW